jgi:short-subunit dehydrogenase
MDKKTVIITGANKGLGYELSQQMAGMHYRVIMIGRREKELMSSAERISDQGGDVYPLLMDIGKDESIERSMKVLNDITSHVDVLINNAAILEDRGSELLHVDIDLIHKMININFFGALKMIRSTVHLMREGGRIINFSSGAGSFGEGGSMWAPVYGITKTMINSLTFHLGSELSERGISINALCPGWVKTEMGGSEAPRSVEEGVQTALWLAMDAPLQYTGKFFRDKKEIPW